MSEHKHLLGNSPINKSEEDLFNFKHYADKVKKVVQLNSSNSEPLVIGIYGKWGEGKTSFMNLLKHKIEHFDKDENGKEYLVYDFNPWRYSNEDEMIFDFFDGISKRFYVKKNTPTQEVGKWILKYSKYLKAIKISATAGIPKVLNGKVEFSPDKIFESMGGDLKGEQISLDFFKDKVNQAIKRANFKVVVFVDDLDRLDKNEIYTILKLIKLNANFDNFIFITALDSEHISKAIKDRYGDDLQDGKLFLEKIINIPIHLPKIEEEDLQYFFEIKFNQIIKYFNSQDYVKKENELKKIMQGFSSSKFNSPREIIRVLNGFFIAAFGFEDEINLTDLFWIEWIKVKNEELYSKIKNYNSFGSESFFNGQNIIINFNDKIEFGLSENDTITVSDKINGTREEIVKKYPDFKETIDLLFPNKSTGDVTVYDENLNINSIYHFNKYFSFHTERKIKNEMILKIKDYINDKDKEKLKIELEELIRQRSTFSLYTFEKLIKFYNSPDANIDSRNFFYEFVVQNISIVPESGEDMFGNDNRSRIVELIANHLNNDDENDNSKIVIEIAKKMALNRLLSFILPFNKKQSFLADLEILFVEKSKEEMRDNTTFYKDANNLLNRWFIEFWHKYEADEFDKYIKNSLTDIDSIKHLIRNFSVVFNGKKFGALSKEKYEHMKNTIDTDFVFAKIKEFDKKLIEKVNIDNFVLDDYEESTYDHNIKQFIYWYKKEKNIKTDRVMPKRRYDI